MWVGGSVCVHVCINMNRSANESDFVILSFYYLIYLYFTRILDITYSSEDWL